MSVLATPRLAARGGLAIEFESEASAMVRMVQQLATRNEALLATLAESVRALCDAGSCGVSLLEGARGGEILRWVAVAGKLRGELGQGMPRAHSPSGVALEFGVPQLFIRPARHFSALRRLEPPLVEMLVAPFRRGGRRFGAIWIGSHDGIREFGSAEAALLGRLGAFAAALADQRDRWQRTEKRRLAALSAQNRASRANLALARQVRALRAANAEWERLALAARPIAEPMKNAHAANPDAEADAGEAFDSALAKVAANSPPCQGRVTRETLPRMAADFDGLSALFGRLFQDAAHRFGAEVRIHASARQRHGIWLFALAEEGVADPRADRPPGAADLLNLVHALGGRLWTESDGPHRVVLYFTVPTRISPGPAAGRYSGSASNPRVPP